MIRNVIINNKPGHNVLKYLIHVLRNSVVIDQICDEQCKILSDLFLKYGCNVFETMPYASSLNGHKISISDFKIGLLQFGHFGLVIFLKTQFLKQLK